MTPGWNPSAVAVTPGIPSGGLEFEIASAERNDRMLMLSMMGVVVMTIAAIGYAFITRPKDADQAPIPTVVEQPVISAAPERPKIDTRDYYVPVPGGTYQAPPPQQSYTPPPPRREVQAVARGPRTSKTRAILEAVEPQ